MKKAATKDFFVWLALGPRTTAPAVSSREPIRPCYHAHKATHGSFRFPLLYARRHDVRARSPRDVPFQDPAPVPARRRARADARARRRGEGAGPAGGANGGAGFVQPLRLQRPRRPEGLLQGVHGVHRPRRAGRSSRDSKVSNPPYAPSRIFRAVTRDPASRYDSSVSSLAAHFLDVPRDTPRSSCAS